MTQAQHTQGPWSITTDYIGIYDSKGRCIADMDSESSPEIGLDETLANARLIAAAPDMLAALEDMLTVFRAVADLDDEGFDPDGCEYSCVIEASAAIAKAKGE